MSQNQFNTRSSTSTQRQQQLPVKIDEATPSTSELNKAIQQPDLSNNDLAKVLLAAITASEKKLENNMNERMKEFNDTINGLNTRVDEVEKKQTTIETNYTEMKQELEQMKKETVERVKKSYIAII